MKTCGECRQKKGYLRNYPANYERYGSYQCKTLKKSVCCLLFQYIDLDSRGGNFDQLDTLPTFHTFFVDK